MRALDRTFTPWTTRTDTKTANPREVAVARRRAAASPLASEPDIRLRASDGGRRATRRSGPRKEVNQDGRNASARERAVLDSAHVGDIQGAFGTIGQHDTAARRSWRARALALARDHRPGADRDGRRQRRRRRRDLLAGRPELRHEPAVGAAAADPGADRQPGDGRPPRRRHRRRSRAADQRALRALLGLVLGRRPVPAQLPDDRHRVHRRQPRARLLRRVASTSRCRSRRCCWSRSPSSGSFRALGARDVRVRVREPARDPAVLHGAPERSARSPTTSSCPGSRAARTRPRCC